MADMLVKLFNISMPVNEEEKLLENGIRIKRALATDRSKIIEYSKTCGGQDYSDEVRAAFANNPITCYIAAKDKELIGFACFEATAKNFFGPMAVSEESHLSCITVFRNSSLKIVIMGSSGQRFALLSVQRKGFYLSQRFLLLLEKIANECHKGT